jgi:hypothetical protein
MEMHFLFKHVSVCELRSIILAIYAVILGSSVSSFSAEYAASGRLTYIAYSTKGDEIVKWERLFAVQVTDCSWRIISQNPRSEEEAPGFLQWEHGGDGKDTFNLQRYDGVPRKMEMATRDPSGGSLKRISIGTNYGTGYVFPGPVPFVDASWVPPIWLAYASHCYLADSSNALIKPIWEFDDPDLRFTDFRVKAQWSTVDSEIALPTSVVYFNAGKYHVKQGTKHVSIAAAPPYDKGWTNAIYQVLARTNFSGLSVPLKAEFLRLAPKPGGHSAKELVVIQRTVIETLSVTNHGLTDGFLPNLANGIVVLDYRLYDDIGAPIQYKSSRRWLKKDELPSLGSFTNQYAIALENKLEAPTTGRHGLSMLFLFLLLMAVPVLYLIHLKKQKLQ